MENIDDHSQPQCRTCFDATESTFYSLSGKLVKDDERKTIAEFLYDMAKLENNVGVTKNLPQQICGNCLRKLKVSFSFVAQIQKVNKEMMKAVRSKKRDPSNLGLEDTDESENDATYEEDNDSQDNRKAKRRREESFIDSDDPHRSSFNDPFASRKGKRGSCAKECSKNSTTCGNDCHSEMKSMLQKLMNLQQQMNARVKFDDAAVREKRLIAQKQIKKLKKQQCYDKNGKVVDTKLIKSWFPIKTVEQADQVERKIENGATDEVVAFIERLFSFREATVDDVLRYIFDDDLGEQFNLEGRSGKLSLISYNGILHCVRSVFPHLPTDVFLKMIRTYVVRCHSRNKAKKRNLRIRGIKAEAEGHEEEAEMDEPVNDDEVEDEVYEEEEANESVPTFAEFMCEDSIPVGQYEDDVQSETYSVSNEEFLEEEVMEEAKPQINTSANNMMNPEQPSRNNKMKKEKKESKLIRAKIPLLFPIRTHEQVEEIEETLTDPEFAEKVPPISNIKIKNEKIEIKIQLANIASLFPLTTHDEVKEIEKNLKDPKFAEKVSEHVKGMKIHYGTFDKVLRGIFSDKVIWDYNYEGRSGKESLVQLKLVGTYVLNEFSELTRRERLALGRKYIAMSHNRSKQIRRTTRKYDVFSY